MARRFVIHPEDTISKHDLSIEYAEELNEQQVAAATAGGGPLLVVAGAGTGKTRTLVYRVRGGTFHSFCLGILREHAKRIGYPNNFTILDASNSADVIDVIRLDLGTGIDRQRFPRKRVLQSIPGSRFQKYPFVSRALRGHPGSQTGAQLQIYTADS